MLFLHPQFLHPVHKWASMKLKYSKWRHEQMENIFGKINPTNLTAPSGDESCWINTIAFYLKQPFALDLMSVWWKDATRFLPPNFYFFHVLKFFFDRLLQFFSINIIWVVPCFTFLGLPASIFNSLRDWSVKASTFPPAPDS